MRRWFKYSGLTPSRLCTYSSLTPFKGFRCDSMAKEWFFTNGYRWSRLIARGIGAISMKIKRTIRFGTTALLSIATGCSAFKPSHQTLTVEVTDPPHAGVWMNTKYVGEA